MIIVFSQPARDTVEFVSGMALGLLAGAAVVLSLAPGARRGAAREEKPRRRLLRILTR